MAYAEATLTAGKAELTGQFRDDGDGRARFEGAFVLARGAKLKGEDGTEWTVARVKQADVGKGQPPYAWADLRTASAAADKTGEAASEPQPVPEAPEAAAVEIPAAPDAVEEAAPPETPAPGRRRQRAPKSEGGDAAD